MIEYISGLWHSIPRFFRRIIVFVLIIFAANIINMILYSLHYS